MWAEGGGLGSRGSLEGFKHSEHSGHLSHVGHSEHLHPLELQGLRAFKRLKAVATPRAHGSLGALVAFRALASLTPLGALTTFKPCYIILYFIVLDYTIPNGGRACAGLILWELIRLEALRTFRALVARGALRALTPLRAEGT